MLLLVFNWIPYKPIYDTRSFYFGQLGTNQLMRGYLKKMLDLFGILHIGVPQAPSHEFSLIVMEIMQADIACGVDPTGTR